MTAPAFSSYTAFTGAEALSLFNSGEDHVNFDAAFFNTFCSSSCTRCSDDQTHIVFLQLDATAAQNCIHGI